MNTSETCANPADGHCITVTVTNMQGGRTSSRPMGTIIMPKQRIEGKGSQL